MACADPTEHALLRLKLRRFAAHSETQEARIRRADSLRELSRLAGIQIPYKLVGEIEARECQQRVLRAAQQRAREMISEVVDLYRRAEGDFKNKLRLRMRDDWTDLTGPLAHRRSLANTRLKRAYQSV